MKKVEVDFSILISLLTYYIANFRFAFAQESYKLNLDQAYFGSNKKVVLFTYELAFFLFHHTFQR